MNWKKPRPRATPEPMAVAMKTAEKACTATMAKRRRLPDRRAGYTQKATIGGHKIYLAHRRIPRWHTG